MNFTNKSNKSFVNNKEEQLDFLGTTSKVPEKKKENEKNKQIKENENNKNDAVLSKKCGFEDDAALYSELTDYIERFIYNEYTGTLFEPEHLNSIDKYEIGEDFAEKYIDERKSDFPTEKKQREFINFVSREIDRLLPKIYFFEANDNLTKKYSKMLIRRIYDTDGAAGLPVINRFVFQFEHDMTETKNRIASSKASEKQITYLKQLGEKTGFLLWHEDYLSKGFADQMIGYLSEKLLEEPRVFSFFFVSK